MEQHVIQIPSDQTFKDNMSVRESLNKRYSHKSFGQDLTLNDLAKISVYHGISPQRVGIKIEKKIIADMNWKRIPAIKGKGDALTNSDNYVEIKWCGQRKEIKLLQIRLYQQEVGYYLVACLNYDTLEVEHYLLTKEQMEYETVQLGSPTHGTNTANKHNSNKELSVSVRRNSAHHKRWVECYKVTPQDLNLI